MENTGGFHTQGIHVRWVKGSNGIWKESSDFHYHALGLYIFCFAKEQAMYTMDEH
jgi:hypothetical protein